MIDDTTPAVPPRPHNFREVLAASDEDHDLACQLALVALGKATGCSPRAAQRLLDSAVGVGLGTMVVSLTDEGDLALDAAIGAAVARQQAWAFGHQDGKRYGVSHAAPFLSGWLEVMEAEAAEDGAEVDDAGGETGAAVARHGRPRHPDWRQLMGETEGDLPPGVAEAFDRIADYGFVQAIWPVVDKVAIVVIGLTAAVVVAEEADVSGEAVDAFLRDPATGRAFGAAILSQLVLDPERRVERALLAAIRDWKRLELPPAAVAHFGAEPGTSRLRALARWHEREDGGPEGE